MRRWAQEQSLSLLIFAIFVLAVIGQWLAGAKTFNAEQAAHVEPTMSYSRYVFSSDFGGNLMENWQSEFLAVGTMAVFSIYLCQRGSPESKPVGSPHDATGESG
jgi:hypothetical protein